MPQIKSSGTQAAVVNTEHTLLDTVDNGTYALVVDLDPIVAGDVVELRVYDKAISGGTQKLVFERTYGPLPDGGGEPIAFSPALLMPLGGKFTLKQVAGTGRSFDWSVRAV